jgi:hypothetical protein
MKRTYLALGIGFIALALVAAAQQPAKTASWEAWRPLVGNWVGEGPSSQGASYFSFLPDLQDRILVRKNHAEYPAANGRPAIVHDDLMIIYGDSGPGQKAVYFDNEGHVIEYAVSFLPDKKAIVLVSPAVSGAPRYRLSYFPLDQDRVRITFEIAPPGQPESFGMYLEGVGRRQG